MSQDAEKLLAELALQVGTLTSEVMQMRAILTNAPSQNEGWASAKEAAEALKSEGVRNALKLQRLRLDGAFSEQRGEIRNDSKGVGRPTWYYNVPKCRSALKRYFSKLRSVG
jgi:hypothetical protein